MRDALCGPCGLCMSCVIVIYGIMSHAGQVCTRQYLLNNKVLVGVCGIGLRSVLFMVACSSPPLTVTCRIMCCPAPVSQSRAKARPTPRSRTLLFSQQALGVNMRQ